MKKWLFALALTALLLCALCLAEERELTVMIYMCGTDLESQEDYCASRDLDEMGAAGIDQENVSVVILTGGAARWKDLRDPAKYRISEVGARGIRILEEKEARNMGDPATLVYLIDYALQHRPADHYALILWDHGTGPLGGLCLDELYRPDRLTLPELQQALADAQLPGKLDWIGLDACLMGSVEVASAAAPYAGYMIASQNNEPGTGWDYSFLGELNGTEDAADVGRLIIDSYFSQGDAADGLTLSLIDLSRIPAVEREMDLFFREIARDVDDRSFPVLSQLRRSTGSFGDAIRGLEEGGYDLVDLRQLVAQYADRADAGALNAALEAAILYNPAAEEGAGGLSVYHPYANKQGWTLAWQDDYSSLSFARGYTDYIDRFGSLLTGEALAVWKDLATEDLGSDPEGANRFSLQLTEDQQAAFASAQLMILAARSSDSTYIAQFDASGAARMEYGKYAPVAVVGAAAKEDGSLTALYAGRTLYAFDADGNALVGPIAYQMSEDGESLYVGGTYYDQSGRDDTAPTADVLFQVRLDEQGAMRTASILGYDHLTETYTPRVPVQPDRYTLLTFDAQWRYKPEAEDGLLPGFDAWDRASGALGTLQLPQEWHFGFSDAQLTGEQLYAAFQITDLQQNTYMSLPVPVENPNLYDIAVMPRAFTFEDLQADITIVRDTSPLRPGFNLGVRLTNTSGETREYSIGTPTINGTRTVQSTVFSSDTFLFFSEPLEPGESAFGIGHIPVESLRGLGSLENISLVVTSHPPYNYTDKQTSVLAFSVDGQALPADEPLSVLAKTQYKGCLFQLMELTQDAQGGLQGLLHIVNGGSEALGFDNCDILLNDTRTDNSAWIFVHPGTDVFVPFTFSNSSVLESMLFIRGRSGRHYLRSDHLLESLGYKNVESVKILHTYGYDIVDSVSLALTDPIPLAPFDASASQTVPVLTGDVSVGIERLLVADDGIGLRLIAQNHTDQDVYMLLGNRTVNGVCTSDRAPHSWSVPARGTAVVCTYFTMNELVYAGDPVFSLGMTFGLSGLTSRQAVIHLPQEVLFGTPGGTFLDASALKTEPAVLAPLTGLMLSPGETAAEGQAFSFEARLLNSGDYAAVAGDALEMGLKLRLSMTATNDTDATIHYRFSDLAMNGQALEGARLADFMLAPGETRTTWEEIPLAALPASGKALELACSLELIDGGAWETLAQVPLSWTVQSALPEDPFTRQPPLAETVDDEGTRWELRELNEDDAGHITGRIKLTGGTLPELGYDTFAIAIDDMLADGRFHIAKDTSGTGWVTFCYYNSVRTDHNAVDFEDPATHTVCMLQGALQAEGLEEIHTLTFYTRLTPWFTPEEALGRSVTLTLEHPVPLAARTEMPMADETLLEGDANITLKKICVTNNYIALLLRIENAGAPFTFSWEGPALDHQLCMSDGTGFVVPAKTVLYAAPILYTDEILSDSAMTLSLAPMLDDDIFERAVVAFPEPLPVRAITDTWIDPGSAAISPSPGRAAPSLFPQTVLLPPRQRVRPILLKTPLSEEHGRLVSGSASILMEDVPWELEEMVDGLILRDLVGLTLLPDGAGNAAAWYDGLALMMYYEPLFTTCTGNEEGAEHTFSFYRYGNGEDAYQYAYELSPALDPNAEPYALKLRTALDGGAIGLAEYDLLALWEDGAQPVPLTDCSEDNTEFIRLELGYYDREDGSLSGTWYHDMFPWDTHVLSLAPVEELGAELQIRYELHYEDGATEIRLEPWPEG